MIKVIEAISDANIGGAGVLLLNRLKNTDKKAFDTWVILPRGSMLIPKLKSAGAHVVTLNTSPDKSFQIGDVLKYLAVIKVISPDIVNAHGSFSSRIAARMANVPVRLYTRHCVYPVGRAYQIKLIRKQKKAVR